jgi:hypothetical protein
MPLAQLQPVDDNAELQHELPVSKRRRHGANHRDCNQKAAWEDNHGRQSFREHRRSGTKDAACRHGPQANAVSGVGIDKRELKQSVYEVLYDEALVTRPSYRR